MTSYMFTATGSSGWRDIQVDDADTIHQAIALAEKVTGCRVSHGRGGVAATGWHPNLTVNAATGQVTRHHDTVARPVVDLGPPEVMAAIAAVLRQSKQKPK
jgi:hypothetical protein